MKGRNILIQREWTFPCDLIKKLSSPASINLHPPIPDNEMSNQKFSSHLDGTWWFQYSSQFEKFYSTTAVAKETEFVQVEF